MGFLSRFERKMEDGFEGAADKFFDAPISPVQISKRAEKAMKREKMVGAGREYAPTLYTILVNPQDDERLFGYYPTLAGETETYLAARATEAGLLMDGQPLVRFIVDSELKHGKFDIIAEMVSAPIIQQLREEEMRRYGLGGKKPGNYPQGVPQQGQQGRPIAQNAAAQQQSQAAANRYQDASAAYAQPQPQARVPQPVPGANVQPQPVPQPAPQPVPVPVPVNVPPMSQADSADAADAQEAAPARKHDLPYVPEEEIDRSINYGEYTFNSQDFQEGRYDEDYTPTRDARREARDYSNASAQAQTGMAVLVGITENTRYKLGYTIMGIGRSGDNSIVVNDLNASRKHAELRYEDDGSWNIVDLNSMNGTKVNGRRVTSARLNDGDRITIGVTDFLFTFE